jgi:hypothetical protein
VNVRRGLSRAESREHDVVAERVGSTINVNFDDGSIQKTRITHIPGSVDGSESLLTSNKPQTPGLQVPGRVAPFVTGNSQTVRITGPPGVNATLLIAEVALYTAGVANGGYDLDPFEANTLIQFTELNGVISGAGYWDVLVNLTKSNPDAGYNYLSAWLVNAGGTRGPASDTLVIKFDPSSPSDTQAPTTPGNLTAANVTSSSATLNWTASTDNVGVTSYDVSRGGVLLGSVTGLSYVDSGLGPSSTYAYTVVARDAAGNSSGPAAISVSTPITTVVVRINAGGGAFTDNAGNTWSADTGFNTGNTYSAASAINNTVNDALYQTERWDPSTSPELTYSFNVPNGNYQVRLHFAEIYSGNFAVGRRVFDVLMEGNLVVDNLDIYAQVGANAALVVSAPDGQRWPVEHPVCPRRREPQNLRSRGALFTRAADHQRHGRPNDNREHGGNHDSGFGSRDAVSVADHGVGPGRHHQQYDPDLEKPQPHLGQ